MRILIASNRCTTCEHKGDSFTDGTFYCECKEQHLEDEIEDCEDWEIYDPDAKEDG